MKKILTISILFAALSCTNKKKGPVGLFVMNTTSTQVCVQTYCRDSVWLPTNSMPLVAYVTSTDAITSRGWKQLSGPSIITVPAGTDSANIKGLIAGQYIFQYNVINSKNTTGSGRDTVTVIPHTMTYGIMVYPNGKSDTVKPFTKLTIYYSNGDTKVVTP